MINDLRAQIEKVFRKNFDDYDEFLAQHAKLKAEGVLKYLADEDPIVGFIKELIEDLNHARKERDWRTATPEAVEATHV